MQTTFTMTEQFAFGSSYSWRLKDSEIRFRGSGEFGRLVTQRIPASCAQIDDFFAALDLLQVWQWRSEYHPGDIGWEALDGSTWSFTASSGGRTCHSGGENAWPSFGNSQLTSLHRGRFALLHAAMYACFEIESYIRAAKRSTDSPPPPPRD